MSLLNSRYYDTETDLLHMQALLMEARSRTDDWRYPHVGDLNFWFFMVLCHLDPRAHVRLWHDGDRLAAYAILGEDPTFDCQVLPGYEGCGVEAEALAWADARLGELRAGGTAGWDGDLVSGARRDDARRIAFLEQHGFRRREYTEVNMILRLDAPIPRPEVPPGCQVRAVAGAGEVSNRAEGQREVWQPYTVGDVSDEDYAHLMRLPGYDRDLDVVAVAPDGVMAAYVNGWIDPVNRVGDFGPVGTREAYRRQGLGRAALVECLRRMQARGVERVTVSTGVSNVPARGLYESVGFQVENEYYEYARVG